MPIFDDIVDVERKRIESLFHDSANRNYVASEKWAMLSAGERLMACMTFRTPQAGRRFSRGVNKSTIKSRGRMGS